MVPLLFKKTLQNITHGRPLHFLTTVCLLPTVHRQVLTLFYPDSVPLETHSGVTSWGEEGQWINLPTPTYFSPDTVMFVTHFLLLDLCETYFAIKIGIWKPTPQSGMHHWGLRSNLSSELVFLFHPPESSGSPAPVYHRIPCLYAFFSEVHGHAQCLCFVYREDL